MNQEKANIHLTNWDIVGINPNDKNWSTGDIFCFWANNIQSLIGFSFLAYQAFKKDNKNETFIYIALALLFFLASRLFWLYALRFYSSASS